MKINSYASKICVLFLITCLALLIPKPTREFSAFASPPEMPKSFDSNTIQNLIDNIDKGQNDVILKMGYFLRRGANHPLKLEEGYTLLDVAVANEPVGSKRWFILSSIKGFAGFRISSSTQNKAYEAYELLFNNANLAQKSDSVASLERSLYEFVVTLTGNFGPSRSDDKIIARSVLLKALTAYIDTHVIRTGKDIMPWRKAINIVGKENDFIALVAEKINKPNVRRSYRLLQTAAAIYSCGDKEQIAKAEMLLRDAKKILPTTESSEIVAFYSSLVDTLVEQNKLRDAIAEQKELVHLTQGGYEKLVQLLYLGGDKQELKEVLSKLATKENDDEIIRVGVALIQLSRKYSRDSSISENAVQLLDQYLTNKRPRIPIKELEARLILGKYLYEQNKMTEAKDVLTIEHLVLDENNDVINRFVNETTQLLLKINVGD